MSGAAASGAEALELYRGDHQTIDVVLMDVCMPDLDGSRTLSRLQAINPNVRCCFMSGDFGEHTEAELLDRGSASFMRKRSNWTSWPNRSGASRAPAR